jgi:EpsI family protein
MTLAVPEAAASGSARPGGDRIGVRVLTWSALLVAFVYCYLGVFATLVRQWWGNDAFSHGFLIPLVSAYIAWRRRGRLCALGPVSGSVLGVLTVACGVLVLLAGRLASIVALQELSIVLSLSGLILAVAGFSALRLLWFPVAYLLFMIPFWDVVTERLHYPLQLQTATVGSHLIRLLGIPVSQETTLLHLPNATLEVARVCSGVNYLVSVVAVGMAVAYLWLSKNSRRAALVGAAVLIAVAANPVRVALIGVLAYHGLSADVHGPWHTLQGLFVASSGYLALGVGLWVLGPRAGAPPRHFPQALAEGPAPRARALPAILAGALLLAGGTADPAAWFPASPPRSTAMDSLPMALGGWRGRGQTVPSELGSDNGLAMQVSRRYTAPSGGVVTLYVGGYGYCRTAGGTKYPTDRLDSLAVRRSLDVPMAPGLVVNWAVVRSSSVTTQVLYWYDIEGRPTTNRAFTKLYVLWARLLNRPRPRVVALFEAPVPDGEDLELAPALSRFTRDGLPSLLAALQEPETRRRP